ncbi:hypothetical protein BV898_17044 [Hypsibius exemplaris]|uniref:Uncharacterized protein n=1 Tax=Hypsibius exemplaris TaxID=2072580 RepID=A0A9X6RM27_HYPEX|nr:hypothetical protein BV898_17044 [Hypsibius exemplaris]
MAVGLWKAQNICTSHVYPFRLNRCGATAFTLNDGSTLTPKAIVKVHLKNVLKQTDGIYNVCVLTVLLEWPKKIRELQGIRTIYWTFQSRFTRFACRSLTLCRRLMVILGPARP